MGIFFKKNKPVSFLLHSQAFLRNRFPVHTTPAGAELAMLPLLWNAALPVHTWVEAWTEKCRSAERAVVRSSSREEPTLQTVCQPG